MDPIGKHLIDSARESFRVAKRASRVNLIWQALVDYSAARNALLNCLSLDANEMIQLTTKQQKQWSTLFLEVETALKNLHLRVGNGHGPRRNPKDRPIDAIDYLLDQMSEMKNFL